MADLSENNSLLGFVSSLKGGDGLRVEETLGDGYVRLRTSEAERRQAKHDVRCVEDAVIELLRNSRDAGATRIYVGTVREGNMRTIIIGDDGAGIPSSLHKRVFDARVTSKLDTMRMDRWGVHGRGMALFSIKENAVSSEIMVSDVGRGCVMRIIFDCSKLVERADQSTWPVVTIGSHGPRIRGPHNIYRTCVEFALEEEGVCNVYVGSPSEALSSMRARSVASSDVVGGIESHHRVPFVCLPSLAQDARELAGVASELGIEVSERTAHRVIRGEILPLVNAALRSKGSDASRCATGTVHRPRKLSLTTSDEADFQEALKEAFSVVGERYYVQLEKEPSIRITKGRLTVHYDFVEED